jgi:hypothetical protein
MNNNAMNYMLKISITLLACLILLCGCGRNRDRKTKVPDTDTVDAIIHKPDDTSANVSINVYIENSGSMDGYVNGGTEFKGAIRDLLVMMKYHYGEDKIKIFYINNKIHPAPVSKDLADFANTINVRSYKIGDTRSTNLNHIFRLILDTIDAKTVAVLFSDCIYSISGSTTVAVLADEKSLTKDAFLTQSKKRGINLTTTIVKMTSKFYGIYYNKNYKGPKDLKTHSKSLNGEQRPYYICVIGNRSILADFNNKIELKAGKIEGFVNKYVLASDSSQNIYYSVLQSSFNEGRFRPIRQRNAQYIHGIQAVSLPRRVSKLTFAVAVDFSSLPVEDDYIINPSNYDVLTDNFTVKEVFRINKNQISPTDWNRISGANPTHVIVLEAKSRSVSDVLFVLKKQMPEWVEQTHTLDDANMNDLFDQTFGLKYLIEGIAEAYQAIYPNDNVYFQCLIEIEN